MGFEAWRSIVRICDQRNMSGKKSANAVLISNITERDTAEDVEQFDDILKTFIHETSKFENRFGKFSQSLESQLNSRFRGTTMSYSELQGALENIIIDKVATVPTARHSKIDTHAPMENWNGGER